MFLVALLATVFAETPMEVVRTVALRAETHHVQGVAVHQGRVYLTAVDKLHETGLLFEFDIRSGKMLRWIQLKDGPRYHPGGISIDGDSLWIPLAEYRRNSSSVMERRSLSTLKVNRTFDVPDHIGAVAVGPDRLYGANWDGRKVYEWSFDGKLLRKRDSPNPLRIQDWKFLAGKLVASGLLSQGVGALEWWDPETLANERSLPAAKTDRGVLFTNEAMDISESEIYFVPEDSPSRLIVVRRSPSH